MELLTNTRLGCFRTCPKMHEFRYELGISPEERNEALRIGSAFHRAKEAIDLGLDPNEAIAHIDTLDPWQQGLVAAMVTVHGERWPSDGLEIIETELPFDLPLVNPTTGKPARTARRAGKIDRIYRTADGQLVLKDYKTTTEDIVPGSDFWLRLRIDYQMPGYLLAARELGYDVTTILYDVTVRPLLRPYKKTPDDKIRLKANGEPYANVRMHDESPWDYTVRCADAMRADPARYFARHEFAILDYQLDELRHELWHQHLAILSMRKSGHWYRNPGSCLQIARRCEYLPICGDPVDPDDPPAGFVKMDNVHPELELAHATESGLADSARAGQAAQNEGQEP